MNEFTHQRESHRRPKERQRTSCTKQDAMITHRITDTAVAAAVEVHQKNKYVISDRGLGEKENVKFPHSRR